MPPGRGPGLNRSRVLPTIIGDWFMVKLTPNLSNASSGFGNKGHRIGVETSKRPVTVGFQHIAKSFRVVEAYHGFDDIEECGSGWHLERVHRVRQ